MMDDVEERNLDRDEQRYFEEVCTNTLATCVEDCPEHYSGETTEDEWQALLTSLELTIPSHMNSSRK